ncbi:MAG: FliG C-terminal domain-containing protein [Elusimicrobiales bacterium]|nr:FliG C-terminal domain-containing protein [Elusimicrobiales bacterium]
MIKKNELVLLLPILLAAAAINPSGTRAQGLDALRGKMGLETQIEARLQPMAASYLGDKNVSVAVKVNLQTDQQEAGQQGGVRRWDDKGELILPGVPAATSMTKDSSAARNEAAKRLARLGVNSIAIWIVSGEPVSKDRAAGLKKMISDALDLQEAAGDTVAIESAPAEKASLALNSGAIVALISLAVLGLFLYGPFRAFLKRLNENLAALAASAKSTVAVKPQGGGDIAMAGDELPSETSMSGALNISGGGGSASVLTFDSGENIPLEKYVTKDNVDDLRLILNDEPAEVIAKIAQRIPQKLAFAAIPKNRMKEVLEQFLKRSFDDPETIKAMMTRVKDKMAGSFGGETRLATLMQIMDKKSQERTLNFLREKDPLFASVVETRYFKFEDLLRYDETALRRIFRKAGAEPFARCLKNCDAPTLEAFFEMLGPAIRDLAQARMQNMMLTGDTNDSELTILNAVNALAAKGFILPLADVKQEKV